MRKKIILISIALVIIIAGAGGYMFYEHNRAVEAAKPKCDNPTIKGNISMRTGEKIYHVEDDRLYSRTMITPSTGEMMFCTEEDARNAGWRHAETN